MAITATTLAVTAAIAGAVTSGVSAIMAGQAAEAEGKAQEKLAAYNAQVQEEEAKARMQAAKMEEQRMADKQKKMLGYQKAAFSKQGFSIEEGASLDVIADTYGEFAIDRALILRRGLLEKGQLESSAAITRAEGQMARTRGRNAMRASYLSAGGTIASGIGSAYLMGSMLKTPTGIGNTGVNSTRMNAYSIGRPIV